MNWFHDLKDRSVVLHLVDDGPSLRGNLVRVYDDGALLKDVVNLDLDQNVVEAGVQFILRERIERVQVLSGAD